MFHVKDREIVIPGQMVGVDVKHDTNCYSDGTEVYSLVRGLARVDGESVSVIPAMGGYTPKADDTIVGIVSDSNSAGWVVDIDNPYRCFLRKDEANPRPRESRGGGQRGRRNDLRDRPEREVSFKIGDVLSAKVLSVDEVFDTNLTRPWKLVDGLIVSMNAKRVPRLIGKKQSMVNMIKEKTGCKIVIGQNGLVWIKGDHTMLAVDAVRKIEKEAQTSGLTDRVSMMLDEKLR